VFVALAFTVNLPKPLSTEPSRRDLVEPLAVAFARLTPIPKAEPETALDVAVAVLVAVESRRMFPVALRFAPAFTYASSVAFAVASGVAPWPETIPPPVASAYELAPVPVLCVAETVIAPALNVVPPICASKLGDSVAVDFIEPMPATRPTVTPFVVAVAFPIDTAVIAASPTTFTVPSVEATITGFTLAADAFTCTAPKNATFVA